MSKKICAMHEAYGVKYGYTCSDCCNLLSGMYHDRYYRKCIAYGISHSEATDWRKSYRACGLYGRKFEEQAKRSVIEVFKSRKEPKDIKPLEGQISLI